MTFTYTNGGEYELISVEELARLRLAALALDSVKANRDMWRERALDAEEEANADLPPADDCQDAEDCPECGAADAGRDFQTVYVTRNHYDGAGNLIGTSQEPMFDIPSRVKWCGEATEAANHRRLDQLEHKPFLDVDEVRELHRLREALGMRDRDSTKCPCSAASGTDEPVLTMHLGTQRPHESLVWALYNAAYSTATSDEKAAAWFADVRLEDWRSRWPEDEAA